jgi:hypothetical protein
MKSLPDLGRQFGRAVAQYLDEAPPWLIVVVLGSIDNGRGADGGGMVDADQGDGRR